MKFSLAPLGTPFPRSEQTYSLKTPLLPGSWGTRRSAPRQGLSDGGSTPAGTAGGAAAHPAGPGGKPPTSDTCASQELKQVPAGRAAFHWTDIQPAGGGSDRLQEGGSNIQH